MSQDTHPQIVMIELQHLQPSKTNPRKRFPEARMQELTESIRARGVRTPLWVRPAWCVGWDGTPETRPAEEVTARLLPFEIIAGECRYRASLLAERTEAPCIVHEVGDPECLELQLIENLQRDDLDPIEEAEGFQLMLALPGKDGEPLWTLERLAARISRSKMHISRRLKLLCLPKNARDALAAGELAPRTAMLIGRIPDAALRDKAAAEILAGHPWRPGVLTSREAEQHIQERYMRTIKGATFDPEDATLEPAAGPCSKCPHLAKNSPDVDVQSPGKQGVRADTCLNPACFARKEEAAYAKFREAQSAEGRRVLDPEKNERFVSSDGFNFHSSKIVNLDDKPLANFAGEDARGKKWRTLLKGQEVPVVVGRKADGSPIEGVEIAVAVEAARRNGHEVANPYARGDRPDPAEEKQRREKEDEKRRLEGEVALSAFRRVPAAMTGKADMGKWFQRILAGLWDHDFFYDTDLEKLAALTDEQIRGEIASGVPSRLCVLAAVFVLSLEHDNYTNEFSKRGCELLGELGIDLAAIRKELKAEAKKAQIFILPPEKDEKHPAEVTWDAKKRKFRVRDEDGHLESSQRTAFCLGWNDEVDGKDVRKFDKLGWDVELVAAYRAGRMQAAKSVLWDPPTPPDMKAAKADLALLARARKAREKGADNISALEKALKVDRDTATCLWDTLCDEKYQVAPAPPAKAPKAPPVPKVTAAPRASKLAEQIRALLPDCTTDPHGITVKELAEKLGLKPQNLHVWFSTTGKKAAWVQKVGEQRYALAITTEAKI